LGNVLALRAAFKEAGEGHSWHLILGADNWEGFPRWHRPEAVLAAARPAVYPRRGFAVRDLPPGAAVLNFPEMPEQSTAYREWLARDREAALAALPAVVAAVIRARGLYASKAGA
jgi:nicotinate-nucleotide adenylyltransferase